MSPAPLCRWHPSKRRYTSRLKASIALTKVMITALSRGVEPGEFPQRTYRCPCGGWHLTSMETPPPDVTAGKGVSE